MPIIFKPSSIRRSQLWPQLRRKQLAYRSLVEKTSPGELDWSAFAQAAAFVRIDDAELRFNPRQRNEDVQV